MAVFSPGGRGAGVRPVRAAIMSRRTVETAVFAAFASPEPAAESEVASLDPAALLEQARTQATATGYADGYARGREAAESALRDQTRRLTSLLDGAEHDLRDALFALEPQVIELAMTVAGRVVEREIAAHPELVVEVVRAALTAAAKLPVVCVRVHPDDQPTLAAVWESLAPTRATNPVEIVVDPRIQPGGCVIDTASGFVDAQPRTRLDELRMQVLPVTGGPQ